ncbi:MAG: integrative and conjugative element protein (TIGR02256 family) [Sediminicola sp.]|jgi:integrative and conjugative element protein (TIGR02256 family)
MIEDWQIDVNGYGLIRMSGELLEKMFDFRQLIKQTPESGGVLIGKHLNSGGVLLIDQLTPPQKSDKQGRCEFYRSTEHNKLVNEIWQKSDRHSTYVGLWHSHPEPIPNYSSIDKQDWQNALIQSKYEGNKLFFVIVGQTHIRMWEGVKSAFRPEISLIGEYKIGN